MVGNSAGDRHRILLLRLRLARIDGRLEQQRVLIVVDQVLVCRRLVFGIQNFWRLQMHLRLLQPHQLGSTGVSGADIGVLVTKTIEFEVKQVLVVGFLTHKLVTGGEGVSITKREVDS